MLGLLGRGFSRWNILFGGFLALFLMAFGTVLVPSGETWAYENTCRAFRIGTDAGYRYETVCVNVNGDGNADSIKTKYGTLYMSQTSGGGYTYPRLCLIDTSSIASDSCRTFNFSAQKDPVSILNQIEELLKKPGKEYNGSTLNGDVEGQTVSDINEDYTNDEEINSVSASEDTTSTNTDSDVDCTSSGAAKSLGWILCPIIDFLSDGMEGLYSDYVAPALQVNPKLFAGFSNGSNTTSGNPTKEAWEIFRNIANVFFIIFLLVIIFSQLTGVGIDNYGIKKSLPNLIVAALFVNLSYWICVMLVDVSNILGNSLQAMFNGWAAQVKLDPDLTIGGIGIGEGVFGVVTFVGLLALLVSAVWQTGGGTTPGVAVLILTVVIAVVVAVLFLFLLLATREVAVVILTMLSPLAFICYMLPNTKKIFSRWTEIMKGLLLVYPICGAMIGGGNFVSKILLATGAGSSSLFSAFAAIAVGAIPIFFVPTVLKQAFSAMGNLGAKISGLGKTAGSRLSQGAGNAIKGTNRFKNHQEGVELKRQERAANRTVSRYNKRIGKGKNVSQMQTRAAARAQGVLDRMESENVDNSLALMRQSGVQVGGQTAAYTMDNLVKRLEELEVKGRTGGYTKQEEMEMATIARGLNGMKGGASKINGIVREAGEDDGAGGKNLNANFMKAMKNIYAQDSEVANGMNIKDGKMQEYMESLGQDADGNLTGSSFENANAAGELHNRIKSYEGQLNQGGEALKETFAGYTEADFQHIYDQGLERTLDQDDLADFVSAAKEREVTGKSPQAVFNVPHPHSGGGTQTS